MKPRRFLQNVKNFTIDLPPLLPLRLPKKSTTNYYTFCLYRENKPRTQPKFQGKTLPLGPHFFWFVVCVVCAAPDSACLLLLSCYLCSCCGLLLPLLLLLLVLVSAVCTIAAFFFCFCCCFCLLLLLGRRPSNPFPSPLLQCLTLNVKNNVLQLSGTPLSSTICDKFCWYPTEFTTGRRS